MTLGSFFDPPGPATTSFFLRKKNKVFAKIAPRAWEAKIDPKMKPQWRPKCTPEAPRWTKMPLESET